MTRQLPISTRPLWLVAIIVITLIPIATTTEAKGESGGPSFTKPTTSEDGKNSQSTSVAPGSQGKGTAASVDSTTEKSDANLLDEATSQPPPESNSIETQRHSETTRQPNGVPSSGFTNQQPTPSTGKGSTASGDSTTVKTDPNSIDRTTSQPSPKLNSIETPTDSKVTKQPNGMSSSEFSHKNANSTESTSILPPATTENLTDSLLRSIAMIVTIIAALQL